MTASLLFPPVAVVVYFGGWISVALSFFVYVLVNYEYFSMLKGLRPEQRIQCTLCAGILPIAYLLFGFGGLCGAFVLVQMLILIVLIAEIEGSSEEILYSNTLFAVLFGLCYTGMLGSSLVIITKNVPGPAVFWLLLVVICADTGAYFGGRKFGGATLAPRISPKKTISGAVCGCVLAAVASVFFGRLFNLDISSFGLFFYGGVIAIFSVIGDLVESLVKRVNHVKDSGNLLPGHGGLFDRVDGLLFALPLLYVMS